MTIVTNRQRPRVELRQAIYEASVALFRERSYASTTVDEIVARAGVAKGTFFNFFPTKLDVLKAYYATVDRDVARGRSALDPKAPLASLKRYARAVERILRREGALGLELIDATLGEPVMRRIDEDSGSMDTDEFAAFFAKARAHGLIKADIAPAAAAEALLDQWSGAMRTWRRDPAQSLSDLFAARITLLFRGIGRAR